MTAAGRQRNPDIYAPRRLPALGRGYSALVRLLKLLLPLAALAIIGVLVARLAEEPQQQKITEITGGGKTTPGQIELAGAKYEGADDEGRPYTVTADKAVRAMDAPDTVVFENPMADITLQDGAWVAARARSGSFDHAAGKLTLKDGVTVFHDSGYEMALDDLAVDLKKKTAASSSRVRAQGPLGALAAKSLSVRDGGNLVVFGGPVTLTLFQLSLKRKPR